jgi:hypothetical protein
VEPTFKKEGRRGNEQEGFFNSIFSNYYTPFNLFTLYSIKIKEPPNSAMN